MLPISQLYEIERLDFPSLVDWHEFRVDYAGMADVLGYILDHIGEHQSDVLSVSTVYFD